MAKSIFERMRALGFLLILGAPLALAGCNAVKDAGAFVAGVATVNTEQVVTPKVRQQIHLAYQALQVAGANYVELRQCRASEPAFPANNCYRRSVAVAIQAADRNAAKAIAALDNWSASNPRITAASVISGARDAVALYKSIFTEQGIAVAGI